MRVARVNAIAVIDLDVIAIATAIISDDDASFTSSINESALAIGEVESVMLAPTIRCVAKAET
jgi:hypothetical protein